MQSLLPRDTLLRTYLASLQLGTDRFRKCFFIPASEENLLEENAQLLLIMFGEDACIKKASTGPGIMLDKQTSQF